jgi:tRNA dimethylallyltransferase
VSEAGAVPLLAVVGPTGVGKTRAAIALATAGPLAGRLEVVSVDSRQVYRRMDVGTGKPTEAERRAVPHHLLDVVEPDDVYDAARFVRDAARAIDAIRARGRLPVLVGGTGLYYRALVRGLDSRPPADPDLRRALRDEAAAVGPEGLHRRLARLDPEAAARLHPRDLVRVTRALEVAVAEEVPRASMPERSWAKVELARYRVVTIGLTDARPRLFQTLDARVDRMLASGLLDEVRGLLAAGLGLDLPAMQGIGYRHLAPVVRTGTGLRSAVAAMKRDTRRYAKRQWTWFAREPGVTWIETGVSSDAEITGAIHKIVDRTRLFD